MSKDKKRKEKKANLASKLTGKQKAYADRVLAEPTKPLSEIVEEVYSPTTRGTIHQIAHENKKNKKINAYLSLHNHDAEIATVEIMNNARERTDSPSWQRLALDASTQIQNRVSGLPVARTENISTVLAISLDLTGDDSSK